MEQEVIYLVDREADLQRGYEMPYTIQMSCACANIHMAKAEDLLAEEIKGQ